MKIFCPFILLLLFFDRTQGMKTIKKEKVISIFRGSAFYKDYKLTVDKKYYYADTSSSVSNGAFGQLITKYKTAGSTIKIYLRVDGKDTTFSYNISKCDSLMMGRGAAGFYVLNEREYVWAND
jgi:hypothetical protein